MKLVIFSLLFNLTLCNRSLKDIYDYVIVGAGSAGSVLATRLSEDPKTSVLLLEAGEEPPMISKSPGLLPLLFYSKHDWKYPTSTQKHITFGGYWPRGKMLGGSGSMNLAVYLRGNRKDFDYWVKEGCPKWSWDRVLPYYKKVENYMVSNPDHRIHGSGGPVNVTLLGKNDPTINKFIKAAIESGLKYRDPNDGEQTGVYHLPANILDGVRQSSYTNYLKPKVESRKNLRVEILAFVEKILFDKDKTATGVLFSKSNTQFKVKAKKEVIICAGAINTPHLLMLSGIGPKKNLLKFGVKVISDLPVGENLADDYMALNFHNPDLTALFNPSYLAIGSAFFSSKYNNETDYPDIQMNVMRDWIFTASVVVLQRSQSRGKILLKSNDPKVYPDIDYQYFSSEKDLEAHSDGFRIATDILKKMNLRESILPQCLPYSITKSNEYWKCHVTSFGFTIFHPVGTCKMGPPSRKNSVVDCNLRVIGVKKLRVVDASVIMRPVNANPQPTVFMIAEKAVDLIMKSNG